MPLLINSYCMLAVDWRKWRFPPKWQQLKNTHSVNAHRSQPLREWMPFNPLESMLSVNAHRLKRLTSTKSLTLMNLLSMSANHFAVEDAVSLCISLEPQNRRNKAKQAKNIRLQWRFSNLRCWNDLVVTNVSPYIPFPMAFLKPRMVEWHWFALRTMKLQGLFHFFSTNSSISIPFAVMHAI